MVCDEEAILVELAGLAALAEDGGDGVKARGQRLPEGRAQLFDEIFDGLAVEENRGFRHDFFFRGELDLDFAAHGCAELLLAGKAEMNGEGGRLAGTDHGELRLDAEAGCALGGVSGGLVNERDAVAALPVAGVGIEVESHHAAAQHAAVGPAAGVVGNDDGSCDKLPLCVGHVAEAVQPALHGKEALRLNLERRQPRVARPPAERGVAGHRNRVGVAESEHAGVGVLRAGGQVLPVHQAHRHAQRLAAQDQQASATVEVVLDHLPRSGRDRRAIGQHQEIDIREGPRSGENGLISKDRLQALKGFVEACVRDGLAGHGGKTGLPEDNHLGLKRQGKKQG